MGLPLIAIGISIAIAAAMSAYAILSAPKTKQIGMSPASLDSFNVTRAQEGLAIPLVYGRVRIPGNIIWYGELETTAIKSKGAGGGKGMGMGGGGGSSVTGYRYYLSCWQAICFGKVTLVKTYVNDTEETVQASDTIFNDGTGTGYPTGVAKANKLPGIAHVYYDGWYLGDNVSTVPTVHFIVERVLPATLPSANLATGSNPASIIYDLLMQAGVDPGSVDTAASFTAASNFFTVGLNLCFSNQCNVSEAIEEVLKYVEAILYVNSAGQYALKVYDAGDTPSAEIDQDELGEFSLNRKTWSQVPNDFHATFQDETQDFSSRVVIAQNPAAIRLAGSKIIQSVDLKCYRDCASASKRLFEIMKKSSYPASEVKFKTNLAYSTLLPGDIVRISHSQYGIVNADFRLTTVDASGVDRNEVAFQAVQMVETLFDDVYVNQGGTSWDPQDVAPIALTHVRVFELPFTNQHGFLPAFLVLAARENLETSFVVEGSLSETEDYETLGEFKTFSQYGTLDAEYPSSTRTIDDETGITFTPYKFDPLFDTISRAALFSTNRVAIIENEVIAFQTVTALGGGQYKLEGCIRGVLGTAKATHAEDTPIWIAYLEDNIFTKQNWEAFWIKVVPRFYGQAVDMGEITAVAVSTTYKARVPRNPGRIIATRSGSTISFQLWPNSPGLRGAGDATPAETDSAPPFSFLGDFKVTWSTNTEYKATDAFDVTHSGAVDITVKSRIGSYLSSGKTISVGAGDGEYKA